MKTTFDIAPNADTPYTPTPQSLYCVRSDALLTVSEIARLLKVPVSWVYERTRRRGLDRIPHYKLGKYVRFSEPEVIDWLKKVRGN